MGVKWGDIHEAALLFKHKGRALEKQRETECCFHVC